MTTSVDPFFAVISILVGSVLGSFFNVLIFRLPRRESIVRPGSHCPQCGRPIRPWENIPVVSYLVLRGKCAGCGARIPVFYPLVELCTAVASLMLFVFLVTPAMSSPPSAVQAVSLVLQILILLMVIPVAFIDLFHFIIPDSLTLPMLLLSALCSFLPGGISPLQCGLGILAGGGTLYVVGLAGEYVFKKEEAMGGGDVKLMALAGAAFGWKTAFLTIMFGAITGSVGALLLLVFRKFSKDHKIPFGPFLALGLWIAVLGGEKLISLYMTLLEGFFGY